MHYSSQACNQDLRTMERKESKALKCCCTVLYIHVHCLHLQYLLLFFCLFQKHSQFDIDVTNTLVALKTGLQIERMESSHHKVTSE